MHDFGVIAKDLYHRCCVIGVLPPNDGVFTNVDISNDNNNDNLNEE
jgi:hypothetical protein